jgi:hypothetical protein
MTESIYCIYGATGEWEVAIGLWPPNGGGRDEFYALRNT